MHARMAHPAMLLPGALDALRALHASVETSALPPRPWASSSCARARSTAAACAWTCTRAS